MKVAFYTLGCKVNQYETEVMRECFAKSGHTVVSDKALFDAIIINSCTVTAESDRKTRQTVRHFRNERPDAIIALTGCMVQAFSSESKALTEVDIICGNTDVQRVVYLVEKFAENGEPIFEVSAHKRNERFNTPVITEFAERTRAYMKIEDGCDCFCTYCIIPAARGWVRSKPIEDIRDEAQKLADNGFIEIVLVGINLSSYGKGEGITLCDAVDAVCSAEGIRRVRLGSLEPDRISDEMLARFKKQEKFCPQFHLSLQSGCDETLDRMNRHYDTAFYGDLVGRIRKMFENAAITTDIMVGFAGETEEEFAESLDFVKKIGFAKSHIFAYSRREGTVACKLKNQVARAEKSRRSRLMTEATLKSEKNFLNLQIGKTVPVLFESSSNGFAEGYTPNYVRVCVKSREAYTGKILNVEIISAQNGFCLGTIAK